MTYFSAILIIVGVMLVTGAGVLGVRRFVRLETLQKHHEPASTLFLQIGVMYAVLLAFGVSIVWGQFDEAAKAVDLEAAELTTAFHLARGLPAPDRVAIQESLLRYARRVIEDEWPSMNEHRESATAHAALDQVWKTLTSFEPRNARESAIYAESLDRVGSARENRRIRLFLMNLEAPGFVWALLVIVGTTVVALSYFFGFESLKTNVVVTAALSGSIAFSLTTIALLDYPFSGDLRVTPAPLQTMLVDLGDRVGK